MPNDNEDLKDRVIRGTGWLVGMRMVMRLLGVINVAIIARLLTPEDFGLIAMAVVVVNLAEVVTLIGVENALIRHDGPDKDDYDTAWSLRVVVNLLLATIVCALAIPAADYYNDERVTLVMFIISLSPILTAAQNIGMVEYQRNLQYSKDFQHQVIARCIGFVVTILLAFTLRNYWALVIAMVLNSFWLMSVSYFLHPHRPRFTLSRSKQYLAFSANMFLNGLFMKIARKGGVLIVGRIATTQTAGLFHTAQNVSNMIGGEIVLPFVRALVPAFAKVKNDMERLGRSHVTSFSATMIVSTSVCVGVSAVAPHAVYVLLGSQWGGATIFLYLLSFAVAIELAQSTFGPLLITMQKERYLLYISFMRVVIFVAGVAYCLDILEPVLVPKLIIVADIISLAAGSLVLCRIIPNTTAATIHVYVRCIAAASAMYFVAVYIPLAESYPSIVQLLVRVPAGAITYISVLVFIWRISGKPVGAEELIEEKAKLAYRSLREKIHRRG